MIIKEYKHPEPSGGRVRVFVDLACDYCKKEKLFYQKRWLTSEKWYCSSKCKYLDNGWAKILKCAHCNKSFYKLNSKLSSSKSGKYFCSRKCKDIAQKYLKEIQPNHYGNGCGISGYRDKALNFYGEKCNRCGFNNKKALEVHHKDRNRKNNNIKNLEVLCANCHSIEHMGL